MAISVFDLFKIGIGPSSSHTVGPMKAAYDFVEALRSQDLLERVAGIEIHLYGSLSATGKGHATDRACVMGLMGERPDRIDPAVVGPCIEELLESQTLLLGGQVAVPFLWARDLQWHEESLPYHPNAMTLVAKGHSEEVKRETYYSVGGGFVIDEAQARDGALDSDTTPLPYDFNSGAELMALCRLHGMSISELMLENEKAWRSEAEVRSGLWDIWQAMQACVNRGVEGEGVLPGGLNVKRRAASLYRRLEAMGDDAGLIATTFSAMDWVNVYALAVNEENAAGGRMVTAPTNGAAGIIPAVLHYYMKFQPGASEKDVVNFLLTAGAVGILCKKNASISGAEVGCQGEVGSACAMAAAGLAEVMGASVPQVENAAEIGLEHNLGLTCDPVGGLVQVPCIERNAIASVKAINAALMACRGDGEHFISLDKAIRTMRDTGADMQEKYKETSKGGLAVNAIEC
ncbi:MULTISPECIES: L-serine ammonia-lyase [Halomonas]|uniref:L-serine dehydratase n=1 Tax=Halomonas litopenaei TaxID=2109328 RepID=A0ABX5J093_9GAMM|nr:MULTISPECIES: L-serine ammonia-lyase [Halomonas]MBY6109378.1 L-serine ammonia-lyase [Halomonas sp. DP1Y21-3]MCJ8284147.1 L-serine ammonia-lyase [Halomonas sp.]NQY69200.1 L-serine ammonia-lyase [Halomonas sp.]PTL92845.1 L-serine ammonia-lyase [Halomonas sp. SYSU XM8]PTL96252.1 L-serine ammonia-lyase [Halomonas litopenaei]|tara:strand:+ start:1153 stop:2532 length:1380 start_codon:yes stop_codon:yes gene_type:complete